MLELKQIFKDYPAGSATVHALKGVDLRFRTSEFVSILGPSGCGKTTLLNIIGGLDQYTSGDLVIDGVSTKNYKDRDWDTYRNHSIGFVFQTYNLIPHQTVLKNVELALTLAGVSKAERRERAAKALERVGLGDQLNKRPNQMSGGQMQRVAIARALVNNPDIILADEPTGALDTETGLQVMELLKEVAQDRLVVMVTHNPELAEQYSSRIIRILDGVIVDDSAPLSDEEYQAEKAAETAKQQHEFGDSMENAAAKNPTSQQIKFDAASESTADVAQSETKGKKSGKSVKKAKKPTKKRKKRSSMSFWTAFKLSLTNLFTKKGRTFLTSFAGSIGIIGIALILSVSQGMTSYINLVEEQTLTSYPLAIQTNAMDLSTLVAGMMESHNSQSGHDGDKVYNRSVIYNVAKTVANSSAKQNDLKSFKKFLEEEVAKKDSKLNGAIAGLQYTYNLNLPVYTKSEGKIIKSDVNQLLNAVIGKFVDNPSVSMGGYAPSMATFSMNVWEELLSDPHPNVDAGEKGLINGVLTNQYDLVYGRWPDEYDEVVLILNENNELSDISLYALGLLGDEYVQKIADSFDPNADEYENIEQSWDYKEICGKECIVILNSALYRQNEADGTWYNIIETKNENQNEINLSEIYNDIEKSKESTSGVRLKITGIIRPNADATATMLSGAIGYTKALTEKIVEMSQSSPVVVAQNETPDTDILTGKPFSSSSNSGKMSNEEKANAFKAYYSELDNEEKRAAFIEIQFIDYVEGTIIQNNWDNASGDTYDEKLQSFKQNIANMWAETAGVDASVILGYLQDMSYDNIVDSIRSMMSGDDVKTPIVQRMATMFDSLPAEQQQAALNNALEGKSDARIALYYEQVQFSTTTLESNLALFGNVDLSKPTTIFIYASSFEAKDVIADEIERYNNEIAEGESQQISYTDFVALVMSAVTTIIDAITYVLIAFVSISLIVSSIMIGVITLISVQERTKEIGILRAIGASKRDVSSMFNAETVIIGFAAGLIGVVFTYILCIPINLILHALTGISALSAYLPPVAALILVAISVMLTLISGLIPSRSAAKKDPVVALRTE